MKHRLPEPPVWQETATASERDDDSWLIVYMDVFTLMLSLFVMMLAYATWAPDDLRQLTRSLAQPVAVQGEVKEPVEPRLQQQQTQADIERPAEQQAEQLEQAYQSALQAQQLLEEVEVTIDRNRINLQISDEILFGLGDAELAASGRALLTRLLPVLNQEERPLSVEGHTDPVPIRNARFPSNWELSTQRATTVLRFLIELGIPATRLRAIGYADTRPVTGNDSPEGRAQNRRVSLVIHTQDETNP